MAKINTKKCFGSFDKKSDITKREVNIKDIRTCDHRVCKQKDNVKCNPCDINCPYLLCEDCHHRNNGSHSPSCVNRSSSKTRQDWKNKKIRDTVDEMLKKLKPCPCFGECCIQGKSPCREYRHLLNSIYENRQMSLPTTSTLCAQKEAFGQKKTDGDYERDIIEEINRRVSLGHCKPALPPSLDYAQVPKKMKKKKAPPPKEISPPKPPKVKKKRPIQPVIPPRIVFRSPKNFKIEEVPVGAGTIQYRLSNPDFIRMGWTKLPPSKKIFYTFQAEPCGPLLDSSVWRKKQSFRYYPHGKMMARIELDGHVEVYYLCGNATAIQVTPSVENHFRLIVYFNPEENVKAKRKPVPNENQPAAIFDSYGNGVVYDAKGKIRLLFDQAEGTLFDFPDRETCCDPGRRVEHAPLHWRWQNFQQIAQKRRLLSDQNSNCPNMEGPHPDFKQFLPLVESPPPVRQDNHKSDREGESERKKSSISSTDKKNKSFVNGAQSRQSIFSDKNTASERWRKVKKSVFKRAVRFEVGASDLKLPDATAISEARREFVETPIRLVMRIERNISLVIMNQCHIHLKFQEGGQHLIFNLGVRIKSNEIQSEDTISVQNTIINSINDKCSLKDKIPAIPEPSLHNMFSIYAQKSPSLQKILGRHANGINGDKVFKEKESHIIKEVDYKLNQLRKGQSHLVKTPNIGSLKDVMNKGKLGDVKLPIGGKSVKDGMIKSQAMVAHTPNGVKSVAISRKKVMDKKDGGDKSRAMDGKLPHAVKSNVLPKKNGTEVIKDESASNEVRQMLSSKMLQVPCPSMKDKQGNGEDCEVFYMPDFEL